MRSHGHVHFILAQMLCPGCQVDQLAFFLYMLLVRYPVSAVQEYVRELSLAVALGGADARQAPNSLWGSHLRQLMSELICFMALKAAASLESITAFAANPVLPADTSTSSTTAPHHDWLKLAVHLLHPKCRMMIRSSLHQSCS